MTHTVPLAELWWRTGRRVGRTIYAILGDQAGDDDVMIGSMDTIALAQLVVLEHNLMRDQTLVHGSIG